MAGLEPEHRQSARHRIEDVERRSPMYSPREDPSGNDEWSTNDSGIDICRTSRDKGG